MKVAILPAWSPAILKVAKSLAAAGFNYRAGRLLQTGLTPHVERAAEELDGLLSVCLQS